VDIMSGTMSAHEESELSWNRVIFVFVTESIMLITDKLDYKKEVSRSLLRSFEEITEYD
jgi:hypothetical protein